MFRKEAVKGEFIKCPVRLDVCQAACDRVPNTKIYTRHSVNIGWIKEWNDYYPPTPQNSNYIVNRGLRGFIQLN